MAVLLTLSASATMMPVVVAISNLGTGFTAVRKQYQHEQQWSCTHDIHCENFKTSIYKFIYFL